MKEKPRMLQVRRFVLITATLGLALCACKRKQAEEAPPPVETAVPVAVQETTATPPVDPVPTVRKALAVRPKDAGPDSVALAAASVAPTAAPTAIATAALVPTAVATPAALVPTAIATPAATPVATATAAADAGRPRKPRPGLFAPGVRAVDDTGQETGHRRSIQAPTRPGAQ
jgi:hypothetical protein